MRRYIWSVIALVFVANASEFVIISEKKNNQMGIKKADSQKTYMKKSKGKRPNINFELIKIREGNSTRNMLVPIEDRDLTAITRASALNSKLNSKDGLVIAFTDKNIDIEALEAHFDIKLKNKLQIGYYIFKNNSKFSDIELMNTILNSKYGKNIDTLKPNWKMQMKKY